MLRLGLFRPFLLPEARSRALAENPRNAGPRILETQAAASGSLENVPSCCGDCLDYYYAVFDYNLLFNHDDIAICRLIVFKL